MKRFAHLRTLPGNLRLQSPLFAQRSSTAGDEGARVLADRHHADLYYSLQLLADRLGWDLWTPVGLEWFERGYWQFSEHPHVLRQFLGWADQRSRHPSQGLYGWGVIGPGQFSATDYHHLDRTVKGVTLEQALRWDDWGFVIATVVQNESGFSRFAKEVGAKYVLEAGNPGQPIDWSLDPLVLSSCETPILGRGVRHHQEFRSDTTFRYRSLPLDTRIVRSFVQLMPRLACWPVFERFRDAMPDFTFRHYGHMPSDASISPVDAIAEMMAYSGWAWQDKAHGDGFGHVIHNWAAIGRPLIGHGSHYKGKIAEVFWRDLETCIDLDLHSEEEAMALMREITADRSRHEAMCRAIRETFDREVDYAAEATAIRDLLGAAGPNPDSYARGTSLVSAKKIVATTTGNVSNLLVSGLRRGRNLLRQPMKPDVVICWPRHCDYPVWRAFLRRNRHRFGSVIIVFSEHHDGDDYREFIQSAMVQDSITFVDTQAVTGGRDWRDVATNAALDQSRDSKWIWFTEQDFMVKDGFWEALESAELEGYDVMATYDGQRMHPCNIFIKRETLTSKSSKNFAVVPNVSDHFGIMQNELEEADVKIYRFPPETYYHYSQVSWSLAHLFHGREIAFHPEEFSNYLRKSLEADVPLDPRFVALATRWLEDYSMSGV